MYYERSDSTDGVKYTVDESIATIKTMTDRLASLTVRSVDNYRIASTTKTFVATKLGVPANNNNASSSITITDAGDTSSQVSGWALYGYAAVNRVLYWSLANSGTPTTIRTVQIYSNSSFKSLVAEGSATIGNSSSGTVYLAEKNESGIYGKLTVTIGLAGVDDKDAANTLTISGYTQTRNLQLPGVSEFIYYEKGMQSVGTKYTVDESVSSIFAICSASAENKGIEPTVASTPEAITFANPYADTNYAISIRSRNAADDTEVGYILTSKATTGFTIETIADAVVEWSTIHL
jgi:hypothetical protein